MTTLTTGYIQTHTHTHTHRERERERERTQEAQNCGIYSLSDMIIARDKTASRYTTDAGQSAAILHFSVVYCTMKATNVEVPRAAKKLFPKNYSLFTQQSRGISV